MPHCYNVIYLLILKFLYYINNSYNVIKINLLYDYYSDYWNK